MSIFSGRVWDSAAFSRRFFLLGQAYARLPPNELYLSPRDGFEAEPFFFAAAERGGGGVYISASKLPPGSSLDKVCIHTTFSKTNSPNAT